MNQPVSKDAILQQSNMKAPSSEATHIEQSRAIAQVQGALVVAQQRPRDQTAAIERVRQTCSMQAVAERAFFKYSRGGSSVSGPSIHLATEIARCWGNIDFGIAELRRDDEDGKSEMLAVAWDLETNMRCTNTFIVPHKRDKRGGAEVLTDMRDIYENNANMGARRLRECILRAIPPWLREEAISMAMKTLETGGGQPLPNRIANCLEMFAGIGITREQIEKKIGVPADKMTALDVANLGVAFNSIRRGEISKDEEFGPAHADDISGDLRKRAGAPTTEKTDDGAEDAPAKGPLKYQFKNSTGEVADNLFSSAFCDRVEAAIEAAKDLPALEGVWESNQEALDTLVTDPDEQTTAWHKALQDAYAARIAALTPAEEEEPLVNDKDSVALFDGDGALLNRYPRSTPWFGNFKQHVEKAKDKRAIIERNRAGADHWIAKRTANAAKFWEEIQGMAETEKV